MSQDPDNLNWALLTRYLTGELSPAEAEVVERWFETDPEHRALLEELRAVWSATGGDLVGWNTDRTVAELRRRAEHAAGRRSVASREARGGRGLAPSFVVGRGRSWAALAAGIALVVTGGAAIKLLPHRTASVATTPLPATDVTTRRGQQAEVRLADGSRVVLGAASRLRYERDFNQRDRTVTLEGEAFFDVVHNPAKPFRVRTVGGTAEDVGTAFVVRAYQTSPLQVVVASGAVVLRSTLSRATSPDSLLLTRGQLGRVLPSGELALKTSVNPDAYLAWTRGELVFEQAPLSEVAEELSRWYDADVRLARPDVAERHFSGRFSRRTLQEAVRLVAAVAAVSVERTDTGWAFK
jgi:transmembrane sensor